MGQPVISNLLPFIVIGIASGSVYGLAGTGLVLTYKTSGIFNFAYGSVAALAVFVFYFLHTQHNWPWPLAGSLVLFVLSPIEGLLLELFGRSLTNVGATLKVVATIGLLLIVLGIGTLWYGSTVASFPAFLPISTVRLLGVNVEWQQIILVIVSVLASSGLYYFFRHVRLGVAMRGVVDNADLLDMTGENPTSVRRWAWVIGTIFASLAGLLLAPNLSLSALTITLLVVQAFGAAAIGYFSSLPLTFLGGIAIGVAAAISTKYVVSVSWLNGFPASLPFVVLIIVLVATPRRKLVERRIVRALSVHRHWQAPRRIQLSAAALVLGVLAFMPNIAGIRLSVWSNFLIIAILLLSVGLLVRMAGQISLCQYGFAAIGAAAFSHLTGSYHLPWLVALVLASLLAVPVGALVAIPAIRLSGVFLAVATLGFGIFLEQMLYPTGLMFGPTTNGLASPRPNVSIGPWNLSTDTGFYYVLLVFAVATVLLMIAIQRGRMGRLLGGLADSPIALETQGATANVIRVLIFSISAGVAALSGALLGCLFHFSIGTEFPSFQSLILVAIIIISVGGAPWYAIVAALGLVVFPGYVTVANVNTYLQIVFGLGAATVAATSARQPSIPLKVRNALDRLGGRVLDLDADKPAALVTRNVTEIAQRSMVGQDLPDMRDHGVDRSETGLEIAELSVHFGGIRAVQGVNVTAPLGQITGLIGPNGAGKTTIFNICSGLVGPTEGSVRFRDVSIVRVGTSKRARMGLGRTFQRADLFDSLSVRENVQLGREASMAGSNPLTQLFMPRGERVAIHAAVDEAIELTGIGGLADLQAGLLPAGQRRLVELARAIAGPFRLLLLDEPSAGLDVGETEHFGSILQDIVRSRGTGILLVEHDMSLVRRVCQRLYVLDFGRVIFEGTCEEMVNSEIVRAAYLGSEELDTAFPGHHRSRTDAS
jgi:ABC-type branched-subunit amino acid transport system ATPase component/branched-subunit amino acid ABC-type transport system permease component